MFFQGLVKGNLQNEKLRETLFITLGTLVNKYLKIHEDAKVREVFCRI